MQESHIYCNGEHADIEINIVLRQIESRVIVVFWSASLLIVELHIAYTFIVEYGVVWYGMVFLMSAWHIGVSNNIFEVIFVQVKL